MSAQHTPSTRRALLRGSCRCAHVAVRLHRLPRWISFCHCAPCRKISGNSFLTFGAFANADITWLRGDGGAHPDAPAAASSAPDIAFAAISDIATRASCAHCHSPLFMRYHKDAGETDIALGLVDGVAGDVRDALAAVPRDHIFWTEENLAGLWSADGDGVERKVRAGAEFDEAIAAWRSAGAVVREDAMRL